MTSFPDSAAGTACFWTSLCIQHCMCNQHEAKSPTQLHPQKLRMLQGWVCHTWSTSIVFHHVQLFKAERSYNECGAPTSLKDIVHQLLPKHSCHRFDKLQKSPPWPHKINHQRDLLWSFQSLGMVNFWQISWKELQTACHISRWLHRLHHGC